MKRLKDIGEFGLIKGISGMFPGGRGVVKGIGDDTAALRCSKGSCLLLTTDMLVEGVHFKPLKATPSLIGRKALAVNISDIAATGGEPRHAVVAVGAPPAMSAAYFRGIFAGIKKLAAGFKVSIVGGDTVRSEKIVVSITLTGEAKEKELVFRNGAKAGDAIFVTGSLGGSLRSGRHLKFTPRVKEARFLVKNFKPTSMIDISDGLASDIMRIAESSNVGVSVDMDSIPRNAGCSIKAALSDGEDFELLFTASEKHAGGIIKKWPFKTGLRRIGNITPKGSTQGRLRGAGFRHF